jgi:3-dehydroquinate synthase
MNTISINISLKKKQYKIYMERGILTSIGKKLRQVYKGRTLVVITDKNVERLYMKELKQSFLDNGFKVNVISIEPGEKSKSLDMLKKIYENLCELKIKRKDVIVSLGGGVVGDLSGFAAATYLRGISYVQIPTSLLAQVDSSIGGKVAVDLPWGKNLVGNFYHPDAVFMDPEVLKTLSDRFFSDGMAEVIKYGFIKDKTILEDLNSYKSKEEALNNIENIIYKCCSIKKKLVEEDEKDLGNRMLLNFGHTLGHAVERYYNYSKYSHGEAVSIGMAYITGRTEELSITKEGTYSYMVNILKKYGLPVYIQGVDKNVLVDTIALDKKSSDKNEINLIMIEEAGKSKIRNTKLSEAANFLFPENLIK